FPSDLIHFNATNSYDLDGTVTQYFWDFGDGTNSTGATTDHAYSASGAFTVTLIVTDNDGAYNSTQAARTILGTPDIAVVDITASMNEVYKGQILNVSVTVANEGEQDQTFNITLYSMEIQGWHLIEIDGCLAWYSDGENSADFLLTTSITVPIEDPTLAFSTKYWIEQFYDFGFVQVSTDGGATWISLENSFTTYEHAPETSSDIISNLPGLTGLSEDHPAWTAMSFNLSDYKGQTVLLAFRYMTDSGNLEEGWYISNVTINGALIPNQEFSPLNPPPTNLIQTITVANLAAASQTTVAFSWDTSNALVNKHSIIAVAEILNGEIDTVDNSFTDGVVAVKVNPDLDSDGDVDIFDIVTVASIYGCIEGDSSWNVIADVVEDGIIDIFDIVAIASEYGKSIP
ncbi:MAG: immune inhibitor A, partial [Candidatus Bathyarchaeota archaeon]